MHNLKAVEIMEMYIFLDKTIMDFINVISYGQNS